MFVRKRMVTSVSHLHHVKSGNSLQVAYDHDYNVSYISVFRERAFDATSEITYSYTFHQASHSANNC